MNGELSDEELLYASEEDWAFYNECVKGLPTMSGFNGDGKDKNGEYIPYGSGPHIIRWFKEALEIVKPESILEIGLCCGHGSAMLLNLSEARLWSIDISDREETISAAALLWERFPEKFRFSISNSIDFVKSILPIYKTVVSGPYFDLCWLDGAHDLESITKDIHSCIKLNIPYILFDDYYKRYGDTKDAIAKFPELELVKDMNNLRLYKVNYYGSDKI